MEKEITEITQRFHKPQAILKANCEILQKSSETNL